MCAKWRLGNGACRRTGRSEEEEEYAALFCAAELLIAREGTSTGLLVLDGEKKGNNPLRRIINILSFFNRSSCCVFAASATLAVRRPAMRLVFVSCIKL